MKGKKKFSEPGFLLKLRIAWRLYRFSKNPNAYRNVEKFRFSLAQSGYFEFLNEGSFNDYNWQLVDEDNKFLQSLEFTDGKSRFSKGSLGECFHRFLQDKALQKQFYNNKLICGDSRQSAYILRILITHDLWHILYSYDTTEIEEIALQMFLFRQLQWPSSPFLIGGFILRSAFQKPSELPSIFRVLVKAWSHAGVSPTVFDCSFKDLFTESVESIRVRLGIVPFNKFSF